MKIKLFLASSALALTTMATPASALNIILNIDGSFASQPNGAAALFAFQKAANYWNQTLTNNTTLNINVSFRSSGFSSANVIGSTGSNALTLRTATVYSGLNNSAVTALDAVAVGNLRPLSAAGGVAYRMPDSVTGVAGTGTGLGLETVTRGSVYDNDDTYNNRFMAVNTANARVLGVQFGADDTFNGTNADADIAFNSAFAFDFDPTDGITVGRQDFVSVATHEIGHALGFVSGADTYDFYANPNGPGRNGPFGNTFDWDNGTVIPAFGGLVTPEVLTTLDLFRYSTNGGANGFTADGKRMLQLDPNRGAGFSIDAVNFFNGNNRFSQFATGQYNGDGSQASHWKDSGGSFDFNNCFNADDPQIGVMDPTSGSCQLGIVTSNDLAAMDAIGYNLGFDVTTNKNYTFNTAQIFRLAGLAAIPEPSQWALLLVGFGAIGAATRRRIKTSVSYS